MTEFQQGRMYVTKSDRLVTRRKKSQTWKRVPPVERSPAPGPVPFTIRKVERDTNDVRFRGNR